MNRPYVRLLDPTHRQAGEDRAITAIDALADLAHLDWSPGAQHLLRQTQQNLLKLYGAALRADAAAEEEEARRAG